MNYLETVKESLDELSKRGACTSIAGVDKESARQLRLRISKESKKRGWVVFTKMQGRQLVIWRVE